MFSRRICSAAFICLQPPSAPFHLHQPVFLRSITTHTGPTTFVIPTALPTDISKAPYAKALRLRLLAQLTAMNRRAGTVLKEQQSQYKWHFDRRIRPMTRFTVGQMVYLAQQQPASHKDGQVADKHSKLRSRTYSSFSILNVSSHTRTVDENRIANS